MQKLIMPFSKCMMLCGYKNNQYLKNWGYNHYGVDISTIQGGAGNDHNIYASGDGMILSAGYDNSGGNVIVVQYQQVYNHHTEEVYNVVGRYMHLASINVEVGKNVSKGDILGVEGNTNTGDYHLHIEFDTDTVYPNYSPQVSSSDDWKSYDEGNILKKGIDSTVNPSYLFHVDVGQEIVKPTYNPTWLNPEDFTIPKLEENLQESNDYDKLELKLEQTQDELLTTQGELQATKTLLKSVKNVLVKIENLLGDVNL